MQKIILIFNVVYLVCGVSFADTEQKLASYACQSVKDADGLRYLLSGDLFKNDKGEIYTNLQFSVHLISRNATIPTTMESELTISKKDKYFVEFEDEWVLAEINYGPDKKSSWFTDQEKGKKYELNCTMTPGF